MPIWPFKRSEADAAAERLLGAVVAASRRPAFFGPGGVPDTMEGRFECTTAHAVLALIRLRASPESADLAQLFTDKLFRAFDAGLREAGVGDLSVPKRMRKLAGAFYGRLEAYAGPLASGDAVALRGALVRNLLSGGDTPFADEAAKSLIVLAERQASLPIQALETEAAWGAP